MTATKALPAIMLEQIWTSRADKIPPLVIIDYRVHAHAINEVFQINETASKWLRAAWTLRLTRCPEYLNYGPARVIVVDDYRDENLGYWRHIVCDQLGLNRYKGTRDIQPGASEEAIAQLLHGRQRLQLIFDVGYEVAEELGIPVFRKALFEADDWAGVIYRLRRSNQISERQVLLSTIDTDWHCLVDSSCKILWANTKHYSPRLRGNVEVIAHTKKIFGEVLDHPSKLCFIKSKHGDASDNLSSGSPVSLFDLTAQNPMYNIESDPGLMTRLIEECNNPEPNRSIEAYDRARTYCLNNQLPIPLLRK